MLQLLTVLVGGVYGRGTPGLQVDLSEQFIEASACLDRQTKPLLDILGDPLRWTAVAISNFEREFVEIY